MNRVLETLRFLQTAAVVTTPDADAKTVSSAVVLLRRPNREQAERRSRYDGSAA